MNEETIEKFIELFDANKRNFTTWTPFSKADPYAGGKYEAIMDSYSRQDIINHLNGDVGIVLSPIDENSLCSFGVIDIDDHKKENGKGRSDAKDGNGINCYDIFEQVQQLDLPLLVCRSKSGGCHLYLFLTEKTPAKLVRKTLKKWAVQLGYGGAEIFPKQDTLIQDKNTGRLMCGSVVNLPYFNAENTVRCCINSGKEISLDYFVEVAMMKRVQPSFLIEHADDMFQDAPPCIRKMVTSKVKSGERNVALYNIVVFLKKAYPETWREKAFDCNARFIDPPLDHNEAKKTITSAGRREYKYKCKEEVCRSRCNSKECIRCKFGIQEEERNELNFGEEPEFSSLVKFNQDPPRWQLTVKGKQLTLSTEQILDFRCVRSAIFEKLNEVVMPMKNDRWQMILSQLTQTMVIVDTPEEASVSGIIKTKLFEFINKVDVKDSGEDTSRYDLLSMGSPVVVKYNERRYVAFRGTDFIDYLKRMKCSSYSDPNLWIIVRGFGVTHFNMTLSNGQSKDVWAIPIEDVVCDDVPNIEIESEF